MRVSDRTEELPAFGEQSACVAISKCDAYDRNTSIENFSWTPSLDRRSQQARSRHTIRGNARAVPSRHCGDGRSWRYGDATPHRNRRGPASAAGMQQTTRRREVASTDSGRARPHGVALAPMRSATPAAAQVLSSRCSSPRCSQRRPPAGWARSRRRPAARPATRRRWLRGRPRRRWRYSWRWCS
jgi:hypothetical protein